MKMISMAAEEVETIITMNKAEMRDGFVLIYTSNINHYKKLVQRLEARPEEYEIDQELTAEGEITGWKFKIPTSAISLGTLCIKPPATSRGNIENLTQYREEQEAAHG